MRSISIDIESVSSIDLSKSTVYRYVEAPDFDILLFGYSVDGGEVRVIDLTQGERIPPEIIEALSNEQVQKWAFNASFERVCLSAWMKRNGYPLHNEYYSTPDDPCMAYLDPRGWRCTMVWSAYLGLPLSLQGAGSALGLDKQKLTEGKELIKYFCVPDKNGQRHLPSYAPEKWAQFKAYNLRDVETEMAIQDRLRKYPVPDFVWDEYHLDQQINDRGIAVDMQLVRNAIVFDERSKQELTDKLQELTMLDNPNSVQQMKNWLRENGLETDTLGKKQVIELLRTAPEPLRSVLVLRQQLAKSSVKKYQAIENCVCADNRVRGCFQFYGGNRTGRYSGRNIQLQNLPQNKMPDLEQARSLVHAGDYEAIRALYDSTPDVLSQLIRTAFLPSNVCTFFVADFSAIEARVIAWLAGEQWRQDLFARGGDIYCQSASQMFGVPVEKHGINGHLRQKGKIAELACIAEGQLVLTDQGLIPIERVTTKQRVWDGNNWVQHDGVVYRGEKEVICYEGLTATPDHLVWVEGKSQPVQFGVAAACGAHLLQAGDGWRTIRVGEDYLPGEAVEQKLESLLCVDPMHRLWCCSVAGAAEPAQWKEPWMPALFRTQTDSRMVGSASHSSKTAMRESQRQELQELRCAWYQVLLSERYFCGSVLDRAIWLTLSCLGAGSNRQQWELCPGQYPFCHQNRELQQPQSDCAQLFLSGILALCAKCRYTQALHRNDEGRSDTGRRNSSFREEKKLAHHLGKARLYDIRNAGPHHRFTVSGKLVHNCGYGGSVGALKAMGALEMGLKEEELKPLVDAWRTANPNIVKLWWEVDKAVMTAVSEKSTTRTHGLTFSCESGMLFITLPSGRRLSYVKPRIGENQFGSPAVTYMGTNTAKQWDRLESYGPKFVENCVQAISRDILCYAMQTLRHCAIVAHVHDELIVEADPHMSLEAVCEQMARTPPWAPGLQLRADGYATNFYKKD